MAAELVRTVLDAESAASQLIDKAKKNAEELLKLTEAKAEEEYGRVVNEAKANASRLVENAQTDAVGLARQAEKLSLLRDRKLIAQLEDKYPQAIDAVLTYIV